MEGITFEDKRYKMFGLSDKTLFSQEEYETLRNKHPEFDTMWQTWKKYEKLAKIDLSAKKNQVTQKKKRLNDLPNEIQVLKDKVKLYYDAWSEIKSDTAKRSEALKLLFTEKKDEFVNQRDSLQNEQTRLPKDIEDMETEIVNIETQKEYLLQDINQYLTRWNGTIPEVK